MKMLIRHWITRVFAFLTMAFIPVLAQQEPAGETAQTKAEAKTKTKAKGKANGPNAKAFQRIIIDLDANQDESLQRSEVPEGALKEFDALLKIMDENGDKALNRGELQASGAKLQRVLATGTAPGQANGQMNTERLKQLDKNGDGFITKDEFPNGVPPYFDRLDLNGDGKIGPFELQAISGSTAKATPGPNPKAESANDPEARLKLMDKDSDGKISREEWLGAAAMFTRLDRDADGMLSADEQKAAASGLKKASEKAKKKTT